MASRLVEYFRQGGAKKYHFIRVKNGLKVKKQLGLGGGKKKGVMVAIEGTDGKIYIGWSKCKLVAGDEFSENRGVDIAVNRALNKSDTPLAWSMIKRMNRFLERVKKVYQDKEIVVTFPMEPPKEKA